MIIDRTKKIAISEFFVFHMKYTIPHLLQVPAFTFCEASVDTIKYVKECPTNVEEWNIAARRKNCESIQQNCSESIATNTQQFVFQYHCLINVWRNATLEVCALNRTILGKTFEKNIQLLDKKVLIYLICFTLKTKMGLHVSSYMPGIAFLFLYSQMFINRIN